MFNKPSSIAIAALIVGLIFFLIGFVVSGVIFSKKIQGIKNQIVSDYSQKLKSRMDKGLIFLNFSQSAQLDPEKENSRANYSLVGKVTKVDSQKNAIEVSIDNKYGSNDLFSYLDEPDYFTKVIKVDSQTKIVRTEKNNSDAVDEWVKMKMDDGTIIMVPKPNSSKEIEIAIGDIKIGSIVSVEAESAFSIKDNKEIKAKKIETGF